MDKVEIQGPATAEPTEMCDKDFGIEFYLVRSLLLLLSVGWVVVQSELIRQW
jgi:hypothetical protein